MAAKLEDICRETGRFILSEKAKVSEEDIELKSLNSLVSYVDKQAEERLVKDLRELLPEAGFITEEETPDETDMRYKWIIDPVDGTTNYLHGIPVFAISVALMDGEEIILGSIYELGQKEMFTAWKDGGAYLNGKPIHVNKDRDMSTSLLATGFPYHDFSKMEPFLEMLTIFFKETRGVRRLGSAATDLAYVACGRFDGFFEYGLSPWDVAAGVLLVKEAGGKVVDFSEGNDYLFGGEIAVSCPAIYKDFMGYIKKYLKEA